MKRITAALLPLLVPACTEAPHEPGLSSVGTAYVHLAEGILEVDYVVEGKHVVVDDMTFPIDDFVGAMIDPADLDDAIAGGPERAAVRALGRYRWPGGRIPYRFDAALSASQQTAVNDAIAHWQSNTPFRFVPKTDADVDFVTFIPGNNDGSCKSAVGRSGNEQEIEVDICGARQIIHEIGHCVGFFHEHQRIDRDDYVTILFDNITPGKEGNFRTYLSVGRDGTDVGEYDFGSIMHYGTHFYSKNGRPTIQPVIDFPIGTATGLSRRDIHAAHRLVTPGGSYAEYGGFVHLSPNRDFQGLGQSFPLGTHIATRGDFATIGDNTASSIHVSPGVVAYASLGGGNEPSTYFAASLNQLPAPFDNSISRLVVTRAATGFRGAHHSDAWQNFRTGTWRASDGQMGLVGDNQISSLYVPPGMLVDLCDTNTGGCHILEGEVRTLPSSIDNRASMIRVRSAATLFEDPNLAGVRKTLPIGTFRAADFGDVGDDRLSSIVVGEGLMATLCENVDGTGTCEVVRGDVSAVGVDLNNKVSWVRVAPNVAP